VKKPLGKIISYRFLPWQNYVREFGFSFFNWVSEFKWERQILPGL